MVTCSAALLACALVSAGETALYEFKAEWCTSCQQMAGTVQTLQEAGFPVRAVDVDQDRATTERFGVGALPCFVLVVNGQEVDRVVGLASQSELQGMLERAGVSGTPQSLTEVSKRMPHAAPQPARAPVAHAVDPFSQPNRTAAPVQSAGQDLLAVSARLKIEDPTGQSFGSGTVIDCRNGEALIITCGHVFRESQGKGKITVDLFGGQGLQGLPGQVVGYDLERDLGFVAIRPGVEVPRAPVASRNGRSQVGEPVFSVGCNGGQEPTVMSSAVTAIDKYLGPPNIQASGMPVQGRSGGGLFNAQGELIGVCNAADPEDQEGLYAALGTIYAEMDEMKLSAIVESAPRPAAVAAAAEVHPVSHETEALAQTGAEPEIAAALADHTGAEVICIVRSLQNPRAKSNVIVLDRASPDFLAKLTAEKSVQENRQLTGYKRQNAAPAAKQPQTWRPANAHSARRVSLSGNSATR